MGILSACFELCSAGGGKAENRRLDRNDQNLIGQILCEQGFFSNAFSPLPYQSAL